MVVCITGAKTGNVAVCVCVAEPDIREPAHRAARSAGRQRAVAVVFLDFHYFHEHARSQTYFEVELQYGAKQGHEPVNTIRRGYFSGAVPPPSKSRRRSSPCLDAETARFDTLTAEAQRAIDLLQERRTALISAAVTGQIDVREAAGRAA